MPGADIDLELELTRLAQRVRRRSVQIVSGLHADLDYSTYLFFLAVCDAPGQVRGSDLAELMGVHKSTASRAVTTLVTMNLVEQVADPSDGRARLLVPTAAAARQLARYRDETTQRVSQLLGDWSDEDVGTFIALLRRYNDTAELA